MRVDGRRTILGSFWNVTFEIWTIYPSLSAYIALLCDIEILLLRKLITYIKQPIKYIDSILQMKVEISM